MRDKVEGYELKKHIMRRVYAVYIVRRVVNSMGIRISAVLVMSGAAGYMISLRSIYMNMPNVYDVGHFSWFFMTAFMETETSIKLLLLATVSFALVVCRDCAAAGWSFLKSRGAKATIEPRRSISPSRIS